MLWYPVNFHTYNGNLSLIVFNQSEINQKVVHQNYMYENMGYS